MVIICLTQRAQRTRRFISLPFTLALEMSRVSLRRENAEAEWQTNIRNNKWGPHTSATSCRAEPATSQAIALYNKIFAIFAPSACEKKTSVWWLYISRKERRGRGVLIPLLFALTLEWSQVSLRQEDAERAEIYGIAYVINVFFISLW